MGPEPSTEPPRLLTLGADAWVSDPEAEVNQRESCFTQGSCARGWSKPMREHTWGRMLGRKPEPRPQSGSQGGPRGPCDCLCPSEMADSRLFYFLTPWVPYAPFSLMGSILPLIHSFVHSLIHWISASGRHSGETVLVTVQWEMDLNQRTMAQRGQGSRVSFRVSQGLQKASLRGRHRS